MFGKSTEPPAGERNDRYGHSVLQEGVTIRGEMEAKGDLRLDGRVEGRVIVSDRLTVGVGGTVSAEIEAGEVVVMGTVEGQVLAHRRVELRKGARVIGDITTPILVIEEGVHFHGNSNMNPESTAPLLEVRGKVGESGEGESEEDLGRAFR